MGGAVVGGGFHFIIQRIFTYFAAMTDATETNELPLLPVSSPATIELCKRMDCSDAAPPILFLASYPKSGTTWLQAIVYHLLALNNAELAAARPDGLTHISHYSPFLEVDSTWVHTGHHKDTGGKGQGIGGGHVREDIQANHALLGKRVFNTHLLPNMIGSGNTAKYIYVVRNAKDACYSFFHHLSNQDDKSGGGTYADFNEFAKLWLQGKIAYGRWSTHLKAWLNEAIVKDMDMPVVGGRGECDSDSDTRSRLLVLSYENLINDLPSQIQHINSFLELPSLSVSGTDMENLLSNLTFAGMKRNASKYNPISVKWKDPSNAFLRKGVVGDSVSAWTQGGGAEGGEGGSEELSRLYEKYLASDVRHACTADGTASATASATATITHVAATEKIHERSCRLLLSLL